MGVDSGLPDFRGDKGFWQAYPLYQQLGVNFVEMATPHHFADDPHFGWGFYGHRTNLYREVEPHPGFFVLQNWIKRFQLPWFVITSNVDGQFQKAGFNADRVNEVHGSIHHMQCQAPCKPDIWEHRERFRINMETMRSDQVPKCKFCGGVARPNVLMFGDWWWIPTRSNDQQRQFEQFVRDCTKPLVVVELGAGTAVPTIRWASESLARDQDATVIRINPREPQIFAPHISIAANAAEALQKIDDKLMVDRVQIHGNPQG